jgi:dipeptidyl aminopeptidase/acylaminoacyl peptidase
MSRTLLAAAAALALACSPGPAAQARPFTIDDLLAQEDFGAIALDPAGRWLAVERLERYDTLGRYDLQNYTPRRGARVWLADLLQGGPARAVDGRGLELEAFSPSGRRLAVTRLTDDGRILGIVTTGSGEVRWLDLVPDLSLYGRDLQWISDDALLVLARTDGEPPWPYRIGRISAERLPGRWAATAAGQASVTALGSGAYAAANPRPPPRRLLRIDLRTGRTTVLASGQFLDLELSPDGRRVALMEAGEEIQPKGDRPLQGAYGVETRTARVSILDLASGARTAPCPACDVLPYLLSWSPDSRFLLVFARGADQPWTAGFLRRIEPASGRVAVLGRDLRPLLKGRPTVIHAGWMGDQAVVYARAAATPQGRLDWWRAGADASLDLTGDLPSPPPALTALDARGADMVAGGALWRVDAGGGVRRVASDADDAAEASNRLPGRLAYQPRAKGWVITGAGEGRRLRQVVGGRLAADLPLPPSSQRVVVASARARASVVRITDPRGPERLDVVQPDSGVRPLLQVNAALKAIDEARILPVRHAGPDGRPLTSWLFSPPRPEGAPAPPLVVRVYAGQSWAAPPPPSAPILGFPQDVRMLLGHGYAVLTPSLPYADPHDEPAPGLAGRILAVVDAAAADPQTRGTFDPARLAVWGHSFGGYTVGVVLTQTSRFRAGVAVAGTFNLIESWGAFSAYTRPMVEEEGVHTPWSAGWTEASQAAMLVPPWRDPDRYVRNSVLFSADRITTPMLIVHGDQDVHPLAHAEQMFSALWRQGKDAILLTYWGEGHLLASPGNVRDFWARAFAFLDERLAVTEPAAHPAQTPQASPAPTGGRQGCGDCQRYSPHKLR